MMLTKSVTTMTPVSDARVGASGSEVDEREDDERRDHREQEQAEAIDVWRVVVEERGVEAAQDVAWFVHRPPTFAAAHRPPVTVPLRPRAEGTSSARNRVDRVMSPVHVARSSCPLRRARF